MCALSACQDAYEGCGQADSAPTGSPLGSAISAWFHDDARGAGMRMVHWTRYDTANIELHDSEMF